MNWYKTIVAQLNYHWESAKRDLPGIQQMIEQWGGSKGMDAAELAQMVQEAERYLKMGHDTEKVRAVMRERLQAA
tara:strand:+ start:496 stop:720 length:225 start_codon:yes stop_codon:yes gene_type:complete